MKKTVLITGAGGVIGSVLRTGLADAYTVRCLDRAPIPGVETIIADITDLDAMISACQGVHSVIHLAASASPSASWDEVLPNNIIGTYNVFEAAAQAGVEQVILASSNHAVSGHEAPGQPLMNHLVPPAPGNLYGVSKCFGEALGRDYADHRGMRVIVLRIGAINPADHPHYYAATEDVERLDALWLSHRDALQLFARSLAADHVQFDIFYGISRNRRRFYDLEHARQVIGSNPQYDSSNPRPPFQRQQE